MVEGFQWPGLLAPSTLPGKVAAGGARKPPACREDDVLSGRAAEATSFVPTRPEDYRKVFGAASACSIPVLNLPPLSDGCGFLGCSALDYLDIFGGFNGRDFGVPYEELFSGAVEEAGGVGAAPSPWPPPDDPTAPPANACTDRGSKEMSYLMQDVPVPGRPAGDIIGSSSSGVAHCLSDGVKQTTVSRHMACCSSKDDSLNGRIHRNEVLGTSTSTILVEHRKHDMSNTRVITDISLYSSDNKETTNGQNLKKTVPSTSSCSRKKHPQTDMKTESGLSKSESSASWMSVCKQNKSFTSTDWLKATRSNMFSAKLSDNHSLHEYFVGKKTEGKWTNDAARSTAMSVNTENDLKVQCIASEHLPTDDTLFPYYSLDHATSSSPEFFPHRLTSHINLDTLDDITTEANHFTEFMLQSPSGTSSQSSEYDNKVEEKHFNTMSKFIQVPPINESRPLHASNSHSESCWYQSYPVAAFLTVSDVILQTQPSQGPPPSRPPPARPAPCSDPVICRTSANCPDFGIATGGTFTNHSFKQVVNDIALSSFGADMSGSSSGVASVAAIKEAMELAQARVKSAKVSMERKNNLQLGLKSGISDGRISREMDKNKAIRDKQRNKDDIIIQLAQKDDESEEATSCASCIPTEGIVLPSRHQEDMRFNCIMIDESVCFHEGNEMEPEEDRILFEQSKNNKSNIMQWTFEHADNVAGLKTAQEVHDDSGNSGKINEVQQPDVCNGNQNKLKEIQELPLSPEKDRHHKNAEHSNAPLAGIPDDAGHGVVAIQGEYKSKINEVIKENQVVLDRRQAVLSGKQSQQVMFAPRQAWRTCNAVPEDFSAEWLDKNVSQVLETKEVVNKERIESEVSKKLEEIERERRQLENIDRARIKLEEKEGEMMKMEEKKDSTRRDPKEKDFKRDLEEEKDLESTLEDEKKRERMFRDAEDERRKYGGEWKEKMQKVEEKERRVTDEGKGKDGEQEKSNLEEEEREKSILDKNERVKRKLEDEEREGKKLVEKEGEMRKLVEEWESERVKIEEKEREERRMQQQREMERKMMEGETEPQKITSEVEKDEQGVEDMQTLESEALERLSVETGERAELIATEMVTAEREQRKLEIAQEKEEKLLAKDGYLSDMWAPDLQVQSSDASITHCQRFSESFDTPTEKLGGSEVNSFTRCKARMERHQRTIERMAIALAEKNTRDIIAQREQAERNRLAETLDADVRRWSNGKEGNLRALLSTLQYILGPESGWQLIPLTDVITAAAVKKAYRKAMLYVHPDKLQQRSANVQQKYICEKVFDLLKEAWNRFNSEEW